MESLLLPGINRSHREQLERNPEAIFDILTMKSVKGNTGNAQRHPRIALDRLPQNEADYEAFVLQFPIDDSISECFALTSDAERKSTSPKFITGAKRPQVTKYSKLKKKLGWGTSEECLNITDGSTSSDSKRSKKAGGVQSKRHKWRTPKEKSVNFSETSEFDSIGEFCGSADASRSARDIMTSNRHPSGSVSDSSGISNATISDHVAYADDVFESGSEINLVTCSPVPELPPVPPKSVGNMVPYYVNVGSVKKKDCFSSILAKDPVILMKNLEEVSSEVAMESRDDRGNTLLHRCVELGNPDGVYMILDRFPALGSDMNGANMTAIELAVKLGQVGCLKVMLDRNKRKKALGTPLLNRLLNISGSNGQSDCLKLLLTYMPEDQHTAASLPGDARGNTAAHVAAKHGHLQCLQTLVTSGYDVTAENLIHQRPLQVANQNSRHDCFEYLLALDICEKLLKHLIFEASDSSQLRQQTAGIRTSVEQLRAYLHRYQKLFEETKQSLVENRESILETLVNIHEDLLQVTDHAGDETADIQSEIRDKLDELAGEIERLEDTFEFSPLEDLDSILSRVLHALDEALVEINNTTETPVTSSLSEEQLKSSMSKLMKDVHEDAIAENWNTSQQIEDLVKELVKTNPDVNLRISDQGVQLQDLKELKLPLGELDTQKGSAEQNTDYTNSERKRETSFMVTRKRSDLKNKDDSLETIQHKTHSEVTASEVKDASKPTWADLGKKQSNVISVKASEESNVPETNLDQTDTQSKNVNRKPSNRVAVIGMTHVEDIPSNSVKSITNEQKDIRQLTLDERMDLLIAGERARERLEDADFSNYEKPAANKSADFITKQTDGTVPAGFSALSPTGTNSICTSTTFTSITSDSSEFSPEPTLDYRKRKKTLGKFSFNSSSTEDATHTVNLVPVTIDSTDSFTPIDLLTTSDSTSYWWDVEEENNDDAHAPLDDSMYSDDLQYLQDESITDEELRRQRVLQHIRSLQRTRFPSDEFAEKITTSTGETMGGFETSYKPPDSATDMQRKAATRIVVDVNSALKAREGLKPIPKPRNRSKLQQIKLEDSPDVNQIPADAVYKNFAISRDQDLTSLDVQWEDMFMSDDDTTVDGKRWYEMSDDDISLVPSWRSDDDTEGSRTPREI